jgi:hypothetical protein
MSIYNYVRYKLRSWAISVECNTSEWVVPHKIWVDVEDNPDNVEDQLRKQELLFPCDPEITRCRTHLRCFEFKKKREIEKENEKESNG